VNLETTLADVVPLVPDEYVRASEFGELLGLSVLAGERESSPAGPWEVVGGAGILFSAPHEVTHIRDGAEKIAEGGTGGLAFALARYTNGCGIATASRQAGDPNWDMGNPYIARAQALAQAGPAVDLHMMRPRGVDLCIGLGPFPGLASGLWQVLVEEAVGAGLRVSLNWPFTGNPRTVTGQLQQRGLRAIQVELSWECFDRRHPAMTRAWSSMGRAARRLAQHE
jgi:hypothetical protein